MKQKNKEITLVTVEIYKNHIMLHFNNNLKKSKV